MVEIVVTAVAVSAEGGDRVARKKSGEETPQTPEIRGLDTLGGAEAAIPAGPVSAKIIAQEYAPAALDCLATIVKSGGSESARVSAAVALLDRAYGKPAQAVTGEDGGPIELSVVSRLGGLSMLELKALFSGDSE